MTLDEVKEKMCDHYCKWPIQCRTEEELSSYCRFCPLDKIEGSNDGNKN